MKSRGQNYITVWKELVQIWLQPRKKKISRRLTIKCQAPKWRLCKKMRRPWQTAYRCWEKAARATERARQQSRETPLQKNCSIWMLRFVKGTLRRLIQYVFVSSGSRESLWNILFARSFKVIMKSIGQDLNLPPRTSPNQITHCFRRCICSLPIKGCGAAASTIYTAAVYSLKTLNSIIAPNEPTPSTVRQKTWRSAQSILPCRICRTPTLFRLCCFAPSATLWQFADSDSPP